MNIDDDVNMSRSGQTELLLQLDGEIFIDVLIIPIFPPLLGLYFGRRVRVIGTFFKLLKIILVLLEQLQHLSILDDFFDFFGLLFGLFRFLVFVLVLG